MLTSYIKYPDKILQQNIPHKNTPNCPKQFGVFYINIPSSYSSFPSAT